MEKEKEKEIQIQDITCCAQNSSCCGPAASSLKNPAEKVEIKPMMRDPNKLNVDIYVPLKICTCEWSSFMNSVFAALTPYMKYIDHQTKDCQSGEARKQGINGKCIIIDEKTKIVSHLSLKKQLPKLLEERNLI
ncbi:unnamed protein product [marine sediment metagenome]|uniref:Uncharacterized protein n=1 Tax=marine sediment metagenome TaxID=412755 RepID=X1IQ07_9ZZZZ